MRLRWWHVKQACFWFGRNAEAIAAIVAIILGVISIRQGVQAVEFANEGIRLAAEGTKLAERSLSVSISALETETKFSAIANSPSLNINLMGASLSGDKKRYFGISNFGLGPAVIYQMDVRSPEGSITVKQGGAWSKDIEAFESFFNKRGAAIDPEKLASVPFFYQSPIRLLGKDQNLVVFDFNGDWPSDDREGFFTFARPVEIRVCYTDLVGYMSGEATTDLQTPFPSCPEPPVTLTVNVHRSS